MPLHLGILQIFGGSIFQILFTSHFLPKIGQEYNEAEELE